MNRPPPTADDIGTAMAEVIRRARAVVNAPTSEGIGAHRTRVADVESLKKALDLLDILLVHSAVHAYFASRPS